MTRKTFDKIKELMPPGLLLCLIQTLSEVWLIVLRRAEAGEDEGARAHHLRSRTLPSVAW